MAQCFSIAASSSGFTNCSLVYVFAANQEDELTRQSDASPTPALDVIRIVRVDRLLQLAVVKVERDVLTLCPSLHHAKLPDVGATEANKCPRGEIARPQSDRLPPSCQAVSRGGSVLI